MAETKASTFEAKAGTFEAKPFKHMARAELKIRITQCVWQLDRISNEPSIDCFCLDIHFLLITEKLLLICYYD